MTDTAQRILIGSTTTGLAPSSRRSLSRLLLQPVTGAWRLARRHDLNPWVFILMSVLGYAVQAMVFFPWFGGHAAQLSFLVLLRIIALVVPIYILLKGRGIAKAFNVSIAGMFLLNTAWHVCYYVYG